MSGFQGFYNISIPSPGWWRKYKNPDGTLVYNDEIAQFHGLNREQIMSRLRQRTDVQKAMRLLPREKFEKGLEKQAKSIEEEEMRAFNKVSEMRERELVNAVNTNSKKAQKIIYQGNLPRPIRTITVAPDKRLASIGFKKITFASKGTKRKKRISKKSKRGKKVKSRRKTRGRKKRRKSQLKPKKKGKQKENK